MSSQHLANTTQLSTPQVYTNNISNETSERRIPDPSSGALQETNTMSTSFSEAPPMLANGSSSSDFGNGVSTTVESSGGGAILEHAPEGEDLGVTNDRIPFVDKGKGRQTVYDDDLMDFSPSDGPSTSFHPGAGHFSPPGGDREMEDTSLPSPQRIQWEIARLRQRVADARRLAMRPVPHIPVERDGHPSRAMGTIPEDNTANFRTSVHPGHYPGEAPADLHDGHSRHYQRPDQGQPIITQNAGSGSNASSSKTPGLSLPSLNERQSLNQDSLQLQRKYRRPYGCTTGLADRLTWSMAQPSAVPEQSQAVGQPAHDAILHTPLRARVDEVSSPSSRITPSQDNAPRQMRSPSLRATPVPQGPDELIPRTPSRFPSLSPLSPLIPPRRDAALSPSTSSPLSASHDRGCPGAAGLESILGRLTQLSSDMRDLRAEIQEQKDEACHHSGSTRRARQQYAEKKDRVPRTRSRQLMMTTVRMAMNRLLDIKTDDEVVNAVERIMVTEPEMLEYESGELRTPPLQPLRINLLQPKCPWNITLS